MKKLILIAFVFLYTINVKAQMWCPPGAEWYFTAYSYYPSANGYFKIKYTNDTVVNGLTYKKLIKSFHGFHPMFFSIGGYGSFTAEVIYTREQNNVVYLNTDTLYNFNATIGSKWLRPQLMYNFSLNSSCDAPRRYVTVVDTGHITINAVYLKTLKLEYVSKAVETSTNFPLVTSTVTVCEKIGNLYGVFEPIACETYSTIIINHPIFDVPLRCYSDNNFALHTNPQYTGTCTYVATTSINELKIKNEELKIYPNPTNGILNIVSTGSATKIEIINILGKLVKEEELKLEEQLIDISNLQNGIYLLKVYNKDNLIGSTKIVKD